MKHKTKQSVKAARRIKKALKYARRGMAGGVALNFAKAHKAMYA